MIVVTGAFGFLGRAVRQLFGAAEVVTLGRPAHLDQENHFACDLAATDTTAELTTALESQQPTCLVHLAGVTPWSRDPDFSLDLRMAETVTRLCNQLKIARLLFMSGWVVYDARAPVPYTEQTPPVPSTPYGQSKLAVERYLAEHVASTKIVNIRAASVYGPGQTSRGLIPNVVGQAMRGEAIRLNARTTKRDYVFVGDLAEAVRRLTTLEIDGAVTALNIGSGRSVSVAEVAETVRTICREDHADELPVTYSDELIEGTPIDNRLSIDRARNWGLLPRQTSFDVGIRAYAAWRTREGLL